MTDEQIDEIATKWQRHYFDSLPGPDGEFLLLDDVVACAIREALAQLRAAPCPENPTPDDVRVTSDKIADSGWTAEAAMMIKVADLWEGDMRNAKLLNKLLDAMQNPKEQRTFAATEIEPCDLSDVYSAGSSFAHG